MPTAPPGFDEAFADLAVLAHRAAWRLLGDAAEAEDIAQEALARALVRWRKVEPYAPAWVTRVAVNLALGRLRRKRSEALPAHDPTTEARGVEDRLVLHAGVARLPRRQRQVIALRYLLDLGDAEVAAALDCSVGTVKQHAARGLAALRLSLNAELVEDLR